jgi:hypothetical protein
VQELTHGIEQVVQRILSHGLEFTMRLVTGLGAMMVLAAFPRASTLGPFGLALGDTAITRDEVLRCSLGMGPLRSEGFGYALLRHYGSIERQVTGSDDMRTQWAGGGRVHKTRVPRMSNAMYDGGLAIVGVGAGT